MILRGIIDHAFGHQLSFRGFAKIGALAKLSGADEKYQREHNKDRINEILRYYRESSYRYFSELTLCWNITETDAVGKIINGTKHTFESGISFTPKNADFKAYLESDKHVDPKLRSIAVEIPETILESIFTRIDGNHRLSAIDSILSLEEDDKREYNELLNYTVPFNILIQFKDEEAEKNETAYFHLINSKSVQLTSEENLKSLFKKELFSDDDVNQLINENASIARELYFRFYGYNYLGLKEVLNSNTKSFFLDIIQLESITLDLDKLQNSIQLIDNLVLEYNEKSILAHKNIVLALVYAQNEFEIKKNKKFKQWVFNNHLNDIKEVKPLTLIQIFESIHAKRTYKVFVAMPYWSHSEVNEYNALFKEICREVSSKLNTSVELIPVMRFSGKSQRIDSRLIKSIKECDVFIADITGCNKNVIFEVGLAEGMDKPMILIKDEADLKIPPFDMDKLQYIPYNKSIYYSAIKGIVLRNLTILLKDDFKIN